MAKYNSLHFDLVNQSNYRCHRLLYDSLHFVLVKVMLMISYLFLCAGRGYCDAHVGLSVRVSFLVGGFHLTQG